jgi:hypothetical protein
MTGEWSAGKRRTFQSIGRETLRKAAIIGMVAERGKASASEPPTKEESTRNLCRRPSNPQWLESIGHRFAVVVRP